MARTQEHAPESTTQHVGEQVMEQVNGTTLDVASLPDNAIWMNIDGYVGVLPWHQHEELSTEENIAYNEGRKQTALRRMQTVVRNAERNGKDVRAEVNAFLSRFVADAEQSFQTIGQRRREIARELLAERLEATGVAKNVAAAKELRTDPKAFIPDAKNGGKDILPGFAVKYADEVNARLAAWINTRQERRTRGSGKAGVTVDDGFVVDDL